MPTVQASKQFVVERSLAMRAAPQTVFEHIEDLHRWVDWSPWEGMDPSLQRSYSGASHGVGSVYGWKGNRKVGAGSMEIVKAVASTEVGITLRFLKPFKATNETTFMLAPEGDSTRVTWTMRGPVTLISKVMGIFMPMDKFIGKDFDKGLAQLKSIVEQA
jgi:Polyketide cyclase / dehydrase and lipid transport